MPGGAVRMVSARSGSSAVGAGVVDEEAESVGGLPEVAAGAGLSAAVAAVGLPAVVSPAEGAGVVGAGLAGWSVAVVGRDVVEVDAVAGGGARGEGEHVAAGEEPDVVLEAARRVRSGRPGPAGEVDDRLRVTSWWPRSSARDWTSIGPMPSTRARPAWWVSAVASTWTNTVTQSSSASWLGREHVSPSGTSTPTVAERSSRRCWPTAPTHSFWSATCGTSPPAGGDRPGSGERSLGPIRVLVSNVANHHRDRVLEMDQALWMDRTAINVRHHFFAAAGLSWG